MATSKKVVDSVSEIVNKLRPAEVRLVVQQLSPLMRAIILSELTGKVTRLIDSNPDNNLSVEENFREMLE